MEITFTPGNRQFTVDWEDVSSVPGVDYYNVQWGTSTGFSSNCDASSTCDQSSPTASTLIINDLDGVDLDNNRLYYVRIQAVNTNGPGPWSSRISVEPGTLVAPVISSVGEDTTHTKKLIVTWDPGSETDSKPPLTGFKISYRTGTGSWGSPTTLRTSPLTTGLTVSGTTYTYTITVPNSGIEYQVRVLATNNNGDGPWSTPVNGTPGQNAVPSGVTLADGTANSDGIVNSAAISWSAPSSGPTVVSYTVQWRTCGTSGYSCGNYSISRTVTGDPIPTTYEIPVTSLSDGMHYQVRVRANYASTAGGSSAYAESTDVYLVTITDNNDPQTSTRNDDTVAVTTRS